MNMNKSILLVEDNPEDVRLTQRALQKNHISNELFVLTDGVEALEYLIQASGEPGGLPAVVLLDLKLPRMDGLELLKAIRAHERLRRLPVVILTSSKEEQDILKSYDLGANSYIRKPVDFEHFTEAVRCLGLYWLLLNEPPPKDRRHAMKRPLNALIVEDSEPDARLLIRELKLVGYEVEHRRIETADALKAALADGTWEVVLCDYKLPQFSGDEALRMVKASGLDLPFIFVSGTIGEETAVQAMKAGAHDYVMKNNLARLAAAVERELGEAQMRKESRQAEAMMRISEHKYRHLFESMHDAAFLVAENTGRIMDVNRQAELLLDRTRGEIIGLNQRELYPSQTAPPFLLPPGEIIGGEAGSHEVEIVRRDGATVPTDLRLSRLRLQGHNLLLFLFRDIARRRRTENELRESREQLRALAARLQAVREQERTRVAREIHDELGQMLTAIKMDLRWIENDLEQINDPRLNPLLDKAVAATELTDALAQSVQRIAAELRPGILDRLGLVMALTHEAEHFQQRTGIRCRLKTLEDEPSLPVESVTAVFRIFQEAMTNVARHAQASEVEIELESSPEFLTLKICDNGGGIKPSDLLGGHSLGILGMQERARHMGGEVTVKPGPAGGTMVTLQIPHQQNQEK